MAQIISNITTYPQVVTINETKTVAYTEEIKMIQKIKHNLSIVYFAGVVVLMTTLFL